MTALELRLGLRSGDPIRYALTASLSPQQVETVYSCNLEFVILNTGHIALK